MQLDPKIQLGSLPKTNTAYTTVQTWFWTPSPPKVCVSAGVWMDLEAGVARVGDRPPSSLDHLHQL